MYVPDLCFNRTILKSKYFKKIHHQNKNHKDDGERFIRREIEGTTSDKYIIVIPF